jgi:nitrogen fixation/metabolism regulation signal transduction histidine kinase
VALRNRRLKRVLRILPVLTALVVLLVSLVLVSDVQQEASGYNRTYLWVLVLTLLALALLALAIVARFVSLYRKVRAGEPGARLSARWVRNFLILTLPPALVVYGFSALFLTRTVNNWFDVQVEAALSDSLRLGQEFLDQRTLEVRDQVRRISRSLAAEADPDDLRRSLLEGVRRSGPTELTLFASNGRLLTTANYDAFADLPERPGDYVLLQAVEQGEYAAAEPVADDRLVIRVLQRLAARRPGGEALLLQAIYPLPEDVTALTASIEQEYYRYRNVSYLRGSLQQSFLLILSLVLAMTMLLAILAALAAARRMVAPLSSLAQATQRVAAGDLRQAVKTDRRDELGFLAESFNEMTGALLEASDEAESSRARLQAQGDYLETVLGNLSAGVLTLDATGRLLRVNRAAERILDLPEGGSLGRRLAELAEERPELRPLVEVIGRQSQRGTSGWQQEIPLQSDTGPLALLARGSSLPTAEPDGAGGQVVVFDDVTMLNRAQRDAAWAEVARRLAHEVKNPLTPIRLAAERLRMKLMDRLEGRDAEMLDRAAGTIVAQVEALRELVDTFSDYARERRIEKVAVNLEQLVREVVGLYRQGDPQLQIDLELCPGPEGLRADQGQLRQLLHNLLRNAIEAGGETAPPPICLSTRELETRGGRWLELEVLDRGPGFPAAVLEQPFEPYVTSKPGGSGLGLAISRKIVSDHDGVIEIGNQPGGGARAVIRLPLQSASRSVTGTSPPGATAAEGRGRG